MYNNTKRIFEKCGEPFQEVKKEWKRYVKGSR